MKLTRSCGILLHPTSLPGKYGIGTLGPDAFKFIDFLEEIDQKLWQVLPLGPTGFGDSPYQCFSTFAGNPLLISFEELEAESLLDAKDFPNTHFEKGITDYGKVYVHKYPILRKAYQKFINADGFKKIDFKSFEKENKNWLDDYSLFMSLKEHFSGQSWNEWPEAIKLREKDALKLYTEKLEAEINFQKFMQFVFFKQWTKVRAYAATKNIKIIGDLPIFVSMDSADAWANPEEFYFDEKSNPTKVAGVPPDYFSKTGQLWGNPLYNWKKMKEKKFSWWIKRFFSVCKMYDYVRVDHFRGFCKYWAVPARSLTAENGVWEEAYGEELFKTVFKKLGDLPFLAEDLGLITEDVIALRDNNKFPGMKILQFAFDSSETNSTFLPHLYDKNFVAYTGTHDNDTVIGWYTKAKEADKKIAKDYMNFDGTDIEWTFIRTLWASTADFALIPMQDFLGLGSEARFNTPGVGAGSTNWQWQMDWHNVTKERKNKLKELTRIYAR